MTDFDFAELIKQLNYFYPAQPWQPIKDKLEHLLSNGAQNDVLTPVFETLLDRSQAASPRAAKAVDVFKLLPLTLVSKIGTFYHSRYANEMRIPGQIFRLQFGVNHEVAEIARQMLDVNTYPSVSRAVYLEWILTKSPKFDEFLSRPEVMVTLTPHDKFRFLLESGRIEEINPYEYQECTDYLIHSAWFKKDATGNSYRAMVIRWPDEFLLETPTHTGNIYFYAAVAVTEAEDGPFKAKLLTFLHSKHVDNWSIHHICGLWRDKRNIDLANLMVELGWTTSQTPESKFLTHLKTGKLAPLFEMKHTEIKIYLEMFDDHDPEIVANAARLLDEIPAPRLDMFGNYWLKTRDPHLFAGFERRKILPRKPIEARLRLALYLSLTDQLTRNSSLVKATAQACEEEDKNIRDAARRFLPMLLDKPPAQQYLCEVILEEKLPFAQQIVLERDLTPADSARKPLFYFLTGQWERYDALDFENRVLRQTYGAADADLRLRIAELIRASGRADYLPIITGGDELSRAEVINADEAEILVRNLTANAQWLKLWQLVFELPLHYSVAALRNLAKSGWHPEKPEERELFSRLAEVAATELITTEIEAKKVLPPALLRAQLHFKSGVGDVAFSPSGKKLAIGLGNGQVVQWDVAKSTSTDSTKSITLAVHKLGFANENRIVFAETVLSPNYRHYQSIVHVWENGELHKLGYHSGILNALVVVDEDHALTGGQDRQLNLWSLKTRRKKKQYSGIWSRALLLPSHQRWLTVLHEGVMVLDFPALDKRLSYVKFGVQSEPIVQTATFSPDETELVVSRREKKIGICALDANGNSDYDFHYFGDVRPRENVVMGLASLPEFNMLIVADEAGKLEFVDYPTRETVVHMRVPLPAKTYLTAFKLSADRQFLALGDSAGTVWLYDLRGLDLRRFFSYSLAQGRGTHLAAVTAFEEARDYVAPTVLAAVRYIRLILEHRARFEIELDDFVAIGAGDFDIELG